MQFIGKCLKWTPEVRVSMSDELKKIAGYGFALAELFGYTRKDGLAIFIGFVWYITCQVIAHTILAMDAADDTEKEI